MSRENLKKNTQIWKERKIHTFLFAQGEWKTPSNHGVNRLYGEPDLASFETKGQLLGHVERNFPDRVPRKVMYGPKLNLGRQLLRCGG